MSAEQKPVHAPSQPAEAEEPELEYRPFVKYAGLGLAALLVLGSGYATYALGYRQGYESGISSGQVESAINSAAVQSVSHLLQVSAADDAVLLRMAADTDKTLGWINDAPVRREAEWLLVCTLLQRNMPEEADKLFRKLLEQAPEEVIWARRAVMAAERFYSCGTADSAAAYYRRARDIARNCSALPEQVAAMESLSAVLINAGANGEKVNAELNEILREATALGEPALAVRAIIMTHEGERLRDSGKEEEAHRCFAALLKLLPQNTDGLSETVSVCFGVAAKECGKTEQAEVLLQRGVQNAGISQQDILCRLAALRHLADLALNRGDRAIALGFLNQAEGLASGRVAAREPLWNCLFVQKGWLLFLDGDKAAAAEQFNRALANHPNPVTAVQALEGGGRSVLDTNAEEASKRFHECAELRRRHFPGDFESLGRVTLLHAHARDLANMPEQAAELYAKAAEYLPKDSPESAENRRMALLGHAHALFRAEKWEAALTAWENVLPLLSDNPELQEEATSRIQDCRGRLQQTDPDFTSESSS